MINGSPQDRLPKAEQNREGQQTLFFFVGKGKSYD